MAFELTANAAPTEGVAPLNVIFNAYPSGGTAPYAFEWDFGDGSTSASQSSVHTYGMYGDYVAVCTVTDATGTELTSGGAAITVSATTPPAMFTVLPTQVCVAGSPANLAPIPAPPDLQAIPSGSLEEVPGTYYDRCLAEYMNTVGTPLTITLLLVVP